MDSAAALRLLVRAADFAAARHEHQRRKDADTPYVNHVIAVARRLVDAGVDDAVTLAAALLHDTIEDTATTHAELAATFGVEVADVVAEVTDDRTLPKAARKREQIRHATELSGRARLVKLADKLDNLDGLTRRAPRGWNAERVRGYFAWSHAVVDNLRGTNPTLEAALDEAFARDVALPDMPPFRAVDESPDARAAALQRYLESMETADD